MDARTTPELYRDDLSPPDLYLSLLHVFTLHLICATRNPIEHSDSDHDASRTHKHP